MSLSISDARLAQTGSSTGLLSGQTSASVSLFYQYLGPAAGIVTARMIRISGGCLDVFVQARDSTTIKVVASIVVGGGQSMPDVVLTPGAVYHIAFVFAPNSQSIYVNGTLASSLARAGTTAASVNPFAIGTLSAGTQEARFENITVWNGYALTPADCAALRDGAAPSTIGGTATLRAGWTLQGTTGAGAVATPAGSRDAGLKDIFGVTANDITSATAGIVYAAPIPVVPAAAVHKARITTSGLMVSFTLAGVSDGLEVPVTSFVTPPTISVNGTPRGALVQVPMPNLSCLLFRTPGGLQLDSDDVATFSAPTGWATTGAGFVGASTDAAVENCVGRSAVGTDELVKTLRPGLNFDWYPNDYWPYSLTKNNIFRIGAFTSTTFDQAGNGVMTSATGDAGLVTEQSLSGIAHNETIPFFPDGMWAIGWDDMDPIANPTTFSLVAGPGFTITPVSDATNTGSGGLNQVRVYNVVRVGTSLGRDFKIRISCPNRNPKIQKLWIVPPRPPSMPQGFAYTPGSPATIDKSDPLEIEELIKQRLPNGLGCVRTLTPTVPGAGIALGETEPEDMTLISDFLPMTVRYEKYPLAQNRPWVPATTPYVYSAQFGTPYQATLGAAINDLGTAGARGLVSSVITISDAATAPLMAGLRIKIDSEEMGILAVNGTAVTVRRGSRKTTPATHTSGVGTLGSVTVYNRHPITMASFPIATLIAEFVSVDPHTMRTGPAYGLVLDSGSWGNLATTDGQTMSIFTSSVHVTGPKTFLYCQGGNTQTMTQPSTLVNTNTLNPATTYCQARRPGGGYPVEITPKLAAAMGSNIHVCNSYGANDDFVLALARRIRDATPPGRKIYIEHGNEPWNSAPPWIIQTYFNSLTSCMLYGRSAHAGSWQADRTEQERTIWVDAFNEGGRNRGSEVIATLNQQTGFMTGIHPLLDYAGGKGYDVGALAIAPYVTITSGPTANPVAVSCYRGATEAECIDMTVHRMYYGKGLDDSTRDKLLTSKATVAAFNAAYGQDAVLYGYEGGDEMMLPDVGWGAKSGGPGWFFSLAAAVTNVATTITLGPNDTVNQAPYFGVGDHLLITDTPNTNILVPPDEWVLVTGVATSGNNAVLTVTRAQWGTSALAHASGKYVRTDWVERSRDMIYHPNWRVGTKDMLAIFQECGFADINVLGYSFPWPAGNKQWGVYVNSITMPGKGDGSDGKANNRLCLAVPGQANSKTTGVYQDVQNVSTRGLAFNEWMAAVGSTAPTPKPIPPPRLRRTGLRP